MNNESNAPTKAKSKPVRKLPPAAPMVETLQEFMPVRFGKVKAQIFGGPFRHYVPRNRRLVGVKMAAEVSHPHDINIPTRDFSVPDLKDMHIGVQQALQAILDGNDIYVGCMGGTGRTGLFMGCLAAVMFDFAGPVAELESVFGMSDPVKYVRKHYRPHAIETDEQEIFVRNFPTKGHVDWLKSQLQPPVVVHTIEKPVDRIVEVPVYTFNPFAALAQMFAPSKPRK